MWKSELTRIIRYMVDDISESPTYSDARLEELILVAGQLVMAEVDFGISYTVDVDQLILSPDPTLSPKDHSFINLICLKSACILDQAAARTAAGRALSVQDGKFSVSFRDSLQGKLALLKESWCKLYEQSKFEYEIDRNAVAGLAIMTPFRTAYTGVHTDTDFR